MLFFDRINRIVRINENHACLCVARRQINLIHPVREVLLKAAKFIKHLWGTIFVLLWGKSLRKRPDWQKQGVNNENT